MFIAGASFAIVSLFGQANGKTKETGESGLDETTEPEVLLDDDVYRTS